MVAWRYEIALRVTFDISLVRYRVEHSKRNRPFPSSPWSFFQSEAKCEIFVMVISFNFNMNEN